MNLAGLSVRNSLLVNLLSVFILLAGCVAMFQMKREAFPNVEYDILTVTTVYPGAPTEDVEKLITIPLEKEIRAVSGIDELTSKSDEGISAIGIYLDPAVKDKDKVIDDIQRAVDRVTTLPSGAEDPEIFELATREFPVLEISVTGGVDAHQLRSYAETLEDALLDLPGVSQIRKLGWRDPEYWVEVDPEKSAAFHVSLQEIMDAVASRNVTVPGGQLTTADSEFNIRTTGEFNSPEEIEQVLIRANDAGNAVKVGDVARVVATFEDATSISRVDGKPALTMVVVKSESGDAISVVADVNQQIEAFRATLGDKIQVKTSNDYSFYVKRRLGVLKTNGLIGFVLVLLILFLFLDPIPASMTALGIPLVIFASLLAMNFFGITVNLVSMLGLLLVLGMLVDDGIIVSENVYRHVEEGMDPRQAAVIGTQEVMMPVTITILTTFAAFGPLMFMEDIIGKFIREVPMVVIIALSASLLEAFIILPSHLADGMRLFRAKGKARKEKRWFVRLKSFYVRQLRFSLKGRYVIMAGLVMTLLFAIWIGATKVKFLLFASEGIEHFYVRAEAQKGLPLENMAERMERVESIIESLPSNEIDSYRTHVGAIEEEHGFDPNAKLGSHLAQLTIYLTPGQDRTRRPQEIADDLRERFMSVEGFERLYTHMPKEGPPTGAPVEVAIKGEDFDVMQEIAATIVDYLGSRDGVSDISTSYEFGKKQLMVRVDEEKAARYGLTVGQVARAVRHAYHGGVATTIKPQTAEEEIDVVVRYPKALREDRTSFEQIQIPNARGSLVRLEAVATIEETEGIYRINHLDGKRVLYVTAQIDDQQTTSLAVNQDLQKQFATLADDHLGYSIAYTGEYEDQMRSFRNLATSYAFALFMIFILLVAMFRSVIQPFIVMAAIPFGVIGVILAFWIHDMILPTGRPLNFFAMMGLVGLTGIVVNDSVVLVDFINRLRQKGLSRRHSILQAGELRLRPVIMTTVTTIGGLISVAYGIGGGDPFLEPMALAIVWGLTFSTVLTLVGIPCLYAIVDDFALKFLHHSTVKVGTHEDVSPNQRS